MGFCFFQRKRAAYKRNLPNLEGVWVPARALWVTRIRGTSPQAASPQYQNSTLVIGDIPIPNVHTTSYQFLIECAFQNLSFERSLKFDKYFYNIVKYQLKIFTIIA
jgi:hypothetical protein